MDNPFKPTSRMLLGMRSQPRPSSGFCLCCCKTDLAPIATNRASAMQIHNAVAEDVFAKLDSRAVGLTEAEAQARLRAVGPNRLEPERSFRWILSLGRHFSNFFSILLGISAAACFIADSLEPGQGMAVLGWAL